MIKSLKLSGIYQIKNNINGRRYIGKSSNISFRWISHISNLSLNQHSNSELQKDYNDLGVTAFTFSILELVNNSIDLLSNEQKYINTLDLTFDYNKYNATKEKSHNYRLFTTYINTKWLIPSGISEEDVEKYKIYKDEDKNEIVQKVMDCQLIDDYPSKINFMRVIRFMTDTLGYTIEDGRFRIENKQYRYKLIVDFDDEFEQLEKQKGGV